MVSLIGFVLPNWQPLLIGLLIMLIGLAFIAYFPAKSGKRIGVVLLLVGLIAMFALSFLQSIFASFQLTTVFIALVVLIIAYFLIFKSADVKKKR